MMSDHDYTTGFWVDQPPAKVLDVIGDVSAYWPPAGNLAGATIDGAAHKAGDEFTYRDRGIEYCRFRVGEIVPARRAVWDVLDSHLRWVGDQDEWNGTEVIFEVRPVGSGTRLHFTHRGLTPRLECYRQCSRGWGGVIADSLQSLLNGRPWTPSGARL
jgi:hypothetical protein